MTTLQQSLECLRALCRYFRVGTVRLSKSGKSIRLDHDFGVAYFTDVRLASRRIIALGADINDGDTLG